MKKDPLGGGILDALGELTKDMKGQGLPQRPAVSSPASRVGRPRIGDQPMTPAERAKRSVERRAAEDVSVWQREEWGFADNRTLARLLLVGVSLPGEDAARHKARQIVNELHRRLNGDMK